MSRFLINLHRNANDGDLFDSWNRHDDVFELCCRNMASSYFDQVLWKRLAADTRTTRTARAHLQPINHNKPTVFTNKRKIARSQPPIGSKQVPSSGTIVVIA
jgi:hypothetical protein